MRIGVMSDSHDHLPNLDKAVGLFNAEGVGHVIHAGDFVAPFAVARLEGLRARVTGVFGNNDGERLLVARRFEKIGEVYPVMARLELGGRRIAVVHEDFPVEGLAHSGLYDVVIYGHTHQVEVRRVGGTLVLNPGEVCGYLTGRATVALVDLERLGVEVRDL